jgi:MFS family permease
VFLNSVILGQKLGPNSPPNRRKEGNMSFEKNIKLLRLISFFDDFTLYSALAIIYFSKVSGSYALGLSIFSFFMISAAIFELPTGYFSDKYGRVKTLMFGSIAFLIGSIFYAIGINYWFLVIGAIFQGLGRSCYSGNNDALLYDNLTQVGKIENFAEENGKISSMSQMALAIAGVLGGIIAYFSFPLLMWLSIIPLIICVVLSFYLVEVIDVSHIDQNIFTHTKQALKNFISNFKLRQISLTNIISFGLGEASWQFESVFIGSLWPVWAIGISKVLSHVGATFSFHFSGRIIKKFTAIKIIIFDNVISKIVNIIALFIANIFSPILMSTTSLLYGVNETASKKLLQKEFSDQQRATMGSLNSLFGSILFAIFAVILGTLADKYGPRNALFIKEIIACLVFIPLYRFKKAISKND